MSRRGTKTNKEHTETHQRTSGRRGCFAEIEDLETAACKANTFSLIV